MSDRSIISMKAIITELVQIEKEYRSIELRISQLRSYVVRQAEQDERQGNNGE